MTPAKYSESVWGTCLHSLKIALVALFLALLPVLTRDVLAGQKVMSNRSLFCADIALLSGWSELFFLHVKFL